MTAAPLEISHLCVSRGAMPVVRDVSLTVVTGAITALLGPNGAGKSSLVLALGGILRPTSGTVTIGGERLDGKPPDVIRAAGLAVVPEGQRVLGELSVADNLRAAALVHGRKAARTAVDRALEIFPELEAVLPRHASLLSGGQQKMVSLAHALIGRPRFIAVDELSLGLAPVIIRRLAAEIESVADAGCGILLIEQFATLALSISRHAYVMERGRVFFSGSADELRAKPSLLHSAYLAEREQPTIGGVERQPDKEVTG